MPKRLSAGQIRYAISPFLSTIYNSRQLLFLYSEIKRNLRQAWLTGFRLPRFSCGPPEWFFQPPGQSEQTVRNRGYRLRPLELRDSAASRAGAGARLLERGCGADVFAGRDDLCSWRGVPRLPF